MNGNKFFLDTNIILYLLNGDKTLSEFLNHRQFYISIITELELLGFKDLSSNDEGVINNLIRECKVISLSSEIKKETIRLRKTYSLKLPDSIIIASALYLELPLITSDSDFKRVTELDLVYYDRSKS